MANKMKVILTYNFGEETGDYNFENVDGDHLGELIGQESANEIISSLDEADGKEATIQLVDGTGKILKEKKIKINF